MKLILFVVAGALLAAVLIAANWGATDGGGPAYPSGRQARKGPPIPTYVVPLDGRMAAARSR
jgi:hypothetical protein